jgi:hypothetical protein
MEAYDVIIIGGGHNVPRLTACDQCARGVWQVRSTHRTSAGVVGYAHCPCGAWQVLLDGRPLATARPRPRPAASSSRRPSSSSRTSPLNPVRAVLRAITRILSRGERRTS